MRSCTWDLDTAGKVAQESVDITRHFDHSLVSTYTGANHCFVLNALGEHERAIAAVTESAGGEDLPLLPGGAAGCQDEAVAVLERAARELESHGAVRYRQEAEHELRKLGRRVHRRSAPGKAHGALIETLTEREAEIAALVTAAAPTRRSRPSCS